MIEREALLSTLETSDPEVARIIAAEKERQHNKIELIASENYASANVLEAQGTILTNKYAEGYPGRRYYGGCENMDEIESLAIKRARAIFDAEHANVQTHSGTQANMAAYAALIKQGDTILGMKLADGGHLSHGTKVSFSGQIYRAVAYGVDRETERIDYDEVARIAREHKPNAIVAGASAYSRIIDFSRFAEIASDVGSVLIVDMAHIAGLVAAGLHPTPVPYAEIVTSTTHKTLRGPRGGLILCKSEVASRVDKAVFPGIQGGPLMHVIAAKAVAFGEALKPDFGAYQRSIVENAQAMVSALQAQGLRIVSGGTDNHLLLLDLSGTGLTGNQAEIALDAVGITTNKNAIPFDPEPPSVTSGIRLGTPAVTTRGFGTDEMRQVADMIANIIEHPESIDVANNVREEVAELCRRFPAPGIDL